MLGELVVPTTMGPSSSGLSDARTPHPVTRDDMDAMAATRRRHRFRLNTRTLLDLPYQGSANDTAVTHRLTLPGTALEIIWRMTTLSRAFRAHIADTDAVFVNGV
ncbi:hypothetical protein, partial [Streptomyces werraensis]|uniref:hypothetical protein n=1 Tax=Streptomyces werraensis TaxID=68284 RepID=UPI0036A65BEB